jgi:hypothetical protein
MSIESQHSGDNQVLEYHVRDHEADGMLELYYPEGHPHWLACSTEEAVQ